MKKLEQRAPSKWGIYMALVRGPKRNQHYVDMDGYHVFYEKIGSSKR